MARALNGEADSQELEEFSQLLAQDESLQQQYELLSRIWTEKDHPTEDNYRTKTSIERIIRKAETADAEPEIFPQRRISRRRLYIAASLFFLLVTGGWFWLVNKRPPIASDNIKQEAIISKNGSRSRSLLPDGSTVWLNAGSKLFYQNDFTGATREVRLEGEAFFDIIKNISKPFIVHTSGIDIKVLGTAFNVKAYPEDINVETTLYRGLVNVTRQGEGKTTTIELKPNQKLTLPKQAAQGEEILSEKIESSVKQLPVSFTITKIDSTKKENERFETAWLYSRLEFRDDSFEELARKLERWYNITVVFTDEKVKSLHVNGSFERETVEQAFAALKEGFPINYKINNNEISVGSSQ